MTSPELSASNNIDQDQPDTPLKYPDPNSGFPSSELKLTDPFQAFLMNAAQTPLLTAEEEVELGLRIQDGDLSAKEHMVRANLRLVVKIARGMEQETDLSITELVNLGVLGLTRAAEKFKPEKGYKFSTYSSDWIHQSIQKYLRYKQRIIHIPEDVVKDTRDIYRIRQDFLKQKGRMPTPEELYQELGIEPERVMETDEVYHRMENLTSLDQPLTTLEEEGTILDTISASDDTAALVVAIEQRATKEEALNRAFAQLSEQERQVLVMHYGFNGHDPKTFVQIAEEWGETPYQISKIAQSARTKLSQDENLRQTFIEEAA